LSSACIWKSGGKSGISLPWFQSGTCQSQEIHQSWIRPYDLTICPTDQRTTSAARGNWSCNRKRNCYSHFRLNWTSASRTSDYFDYPLPSFLSFPCSGKYAPNADLSKELNWIRVRPPFSLPFWSPRHKESSIPLYRPSLNFFSPFCYISHLVLHSLYYIYIINLSNLDWEFILYLPIG